MEPCYRARDDDIDTMYVNNQGCGSASRFCWFWQTFLWKQYPNLHLIFVKCCPHIRGLFQVHTLSNDSFDSFLIHELFHSILQSTIYRFYTKNNRIIGLVSKQEGNDPIDLRRQGQWEIGLWCCMISINPVNIAIQMTLEIIWLHIWNQQPWLPWYPCAYFLQRPPRPWRPQNDLGGHLTSDLKSATLITLVSMCILPPTASEAMATS